MHYFQFTRILFLACLMMLLLQRVDSAPPDTNSGHATFSLKMSRTAPQSASEDAALLPEAAGHPPASSTDATPSSSKRDRLKRRIKGLGKKTVRHLRKGRDADTPGASRASSTSDADVHSSSSATEWTGAHGGGRVNVNIRVDRTGGHRENRGSGAAAEVEGHPGSRSSSRADVRGEDDEQFFGFPAASLASSASSSSLASSFSSSSSSSSEEEDEGSASGSSRSASPALSRTSHNSMLSLEDDNDDNDEDA